MKRISGNFLLLLGVLVLVLIAGCSGKSSVSGAVTYMDDGQPLTRGDVFFRNADGTRMYQGAIKPDGSFALGEIKDGDGIPPGSYKVWIANANTTDYDLDEEGRPKSTRMIEIVLIDPKYTSPATSDLTFEIKSGERKSLDIVVEAPSK